jgi:predicted phosphodiesterase
MRSITACLLLLSSALSLAQQSSSLKFAAIGDWGAVNTDQSAVAHQMASLGNLDFIISAGDNFYEDGVSSTSDPQWKSTFEDVYLNEPALKDIDWIAVLGNHDYHQNPEAQIQYSAVNPRWNMDAHYFSRTFKFGDATSAKFVFIDTIILGPKISHSTKDKVPDQENAYNAQIAWIENELKSARDQFDWVIVVGHYPLYSCWNNKNSYHKSLRNALEGLLERYDVDLYLSGHQHSLQHLDSGRIQQIVTGSGSQVSKSRRMADKNCRFGSAEFGFTVHHLQGNFMQVDFIDKHGDVLYSYTQKSKRLSSAGAVQSENAISSGILVCGLVMFSLFLYFLWSAVLQHCKSKSTSDIMI